MSKYFDIHLHASAWDDSMLSLEDVSVWMTEHNVERSIILQLERTLPRNDEERELMVASEDVAEGSAIASRDACTVVRIVCLLSRSGIPEGSNTFWVKSMLFWTHLLSGLSAYVVSAST